MRMHRKHCPELLEVTMAKDIDVVESACKKCGILFVPKRKWQKYCSTKCRKVFWGEIRAEVTAEILLKRSKCKGG